MMSSSSPSPGPGPPSLPLDRVYTANYCEENIYLIAKRLLEDADSDMKENWNVYVVFISNNTRSVALWHQKLRKNVVVWDYHVILALKPKPKLTVSGASTGRQDQQQPEQLNRTRDNTTMDQYGPPVPGSVPIEIENGLLLGTIGASMTGAACSWIYDLDSRLNAPCRWEDYVSLTFPYSTSDAVMLGWSIPETYQSMFRIIDGEEFLQSFASDRSHMLVPASDPSEPPHYQSPEPPYPPIKGAKAAALGIKSNLMSHFVRMDVENSEFGNVYTLEQAKKFFEIGL